MNRKDAPWRAADFDPEVVTRAIAEATRRALRRHHLLGEPIASSEDENRAGGDVRRSTTAEG